MDKVKEKLKEVGIIITGDVKEKIKNLNRKFHPLRKKKRGKK